MIRLIITLLLLNPALGYAQTYMCKRDGQVVFQDKPCNSSLDKTDGELCSEPLAVYQLIVKSGQASSTEKMCYSKKVTELEKARELERLEAERQKQLKAEQEERAKQAKIRAERLAKAEEARGKRIAAELKAKREAESKKKKLIQETKDKGLFFVEYRVRGSASKADINIRGVDGSEQHKVRTGWSWWMQAPRGKFLYLSAQNDSGYGDVTAEIWVNGIKVKTATSTREYGIAKVSGRL